ncbi:hypothetical protein M4S82_16040 [Planococcus sp. MERTA32b]|nr:hypothetical protein [Planococcus sp. MER TA 32b]
MQKMLIRKMPVLLFVLVIILGFLYIKDVMFESPETEEIIIKVSTSPVEPLDFLPAKEKEELL